MNAISKRLLSWLLVLTMVLSMVPALDLTNFAVETKATENAVGGFNQTAALEHNPDVMAEMAKNNNIDDSDEKLLQYYTDGTCPMCGKMEPGSVQWTKNAAPNNPRSGHYFYDATVSGNQAIAYADKNEDTSYTLCIAATSTAVVTGHNASGDRAIVSMSGKNNTVNIMGSGTLRGNGGVSLSGTNNTLNLYGCKLQWKDGALLSGYQLVHIRSAAVMNMYDGAEIGYHEEQKTTNRSWVRMDSGSTFNMYGGTIKNGYSTQASTGIAGGNVTLFNGGTFNMYGGIISGGQAANYGGNIMLNGGAFNMFGGDITDGKAANGGNIALCNEQANVTMKILGGTVTSGKADSFGGNIDIYKAASAEIGGTALITNGYATSGGNVAVENNRTLTMTGGAITGGEKATSSSGSAFYGGAVFLREANGNDGADFTMTGGLISGCSVQYAGGNIAAKPGSVVTIGASATVENGIASRTAHDTGRDGGNIHIPAGASLTVSGTVTGGEARNDKQGDNIYGAGSVTLDGGVVVGEVEMVSGGTLTLKNAPVITTSYGELTGANGLVLNDVLANINDLNENADITVTAAEGTVLTAVSANAANVEECFTIVDDTLIAQANSGNQLVVTKKPVEPPFVPDVNDPDFDSDTAFFGPGGYLEKNYCPVCKKTVSWTLDNDGRWENDGGHYYVDSGEALDIGTNWFVYAKSDRTVCIFASERTTITGAAFYLAEVTGFTLNIMGNGTFISTGVYSLTGTEQGFRVAGNTANLYGGTFYTTNTAKHAMFLGPNGTVNMYNGAVIGPDTNEGVAAGMSNVILNAAGSAFNMYGGTIQNGYSATQGGNVNVQAGAFQMSGGTIENGVAKGQGGNIYSATDMTLGAGIVSGGKASQGGGNISIANTKKLTLNGTTVINGLVDSDNTGSHWGGNIRAYEADVTVNEGSLIYGGSHSAKALRSDNIGCHGEGADLVINGATIAGDVSTGDGTATVTLSGTTKIVKSLELADGTVVTGSSGLSINKVDADISALNSDSKIVITYPQTVDEVFTIKDTNADNVVGCFTIEAEGLAAAVNDNDQLYLKAVIAKIGDKKYTDVDTLVNEYKENDIIDLQVSEITLPDNSETVYLLNAPNWNRYTVHGNVRVGLIGGGEYKLDAGVEPVPAAYNPTNGQQMVSICDSDTSNVWIGYHYDVKLTHVTLRADPNVDYKPGIYYKSEYTIDYDYAHNFVDSYGVVVSKYKNGDLSSEFINKDDDKVSYTVYEYDKEAHEKEQENGWKLNATSGAVVNIFRPIGEENRQVTGNATALEMQIYVNAYLAIDRTPKNPDDELFYVMADMDNKSDARQEHISYSLFDVVKEINDKPETLASLKANQPTAYENLQKMAAKWLDEELLGDAAATWETITSNILADYNQ